MLNTPKEPFNFAWFLVALFAIPTMFAGCYFWFATLMGGYAIWAPIRSWREQEISGEMIILYFLFMLSSMYFVKFALCPSKWERNLWHIVWEEASKQANRAAVALMTTMILLFTLTFAFGD